MAYPLAVNPDLQAHLGAFGSHLDRRRPPLCPEFELWLFADDVDLEAGCETLAEGAAPPFWAFCWGSGQALARYVLDHPERVRDQNIVDLGTGSGIVALAAARAGAREVTALDLDPLSRNAARLNAELNGLEIQTSCEAPAAWDLMLAADVLYETGLREWVLGEARNRGPILLGDPRRTGTPRVEFPELMKIPAHTFPDVDSPQKDVVLYDIPRRISRPRRERRLPAQRHENEPTRSAR
ncbi:MAG: nicotinamide N-methylase [Deltaproteobacteria bacterium]|nr:nicotinamide N-methylase [Deltaproteobacteria bacterium]